MELVGARLCRRVHESRGGAAVLGRGCIRFHAYFGNRVYRRTEFGDRRPDPRPAVDDSVDEDAGGPRPSAGDGDIAAASAIAVTHPLRTGSQIDQIEDLAIDERQFQDALVLNDSCERPARGFDQRARGFYGHGLRDRSDFEHRVVSHHAAHLQSQVADDVRAEAVGLHPDRVRSRAHVGQVVGAVALGRDETRSALLFVGDFDFGAWNHRTCVIADRADDRAQRLGWSGNEAWPCKEGCDRKSRDQLNGHGCSSLWLARNGKGFLAIRRVSQPHGFRQWVY